jgi:hypothetical protein
MKSSRDDDMPWPTLLCTVCVLYEVLAFETDVNTVHNTIYRIGYIYFL